MNYKMTTPCSECPFLESMAKGFRLERLEEFASGQFPCHKASDVDDDGNFVAKGPETPHCAGALIFLEKQGRTNQMMRIAERLGLYDPRKLNMTANVRGISRRRKGHS